MKHLFEYKNYINFLSSRFGEEFNRSGKKKAFANHIGCQSSFLSQVLMKKANLSLEQGIRANTYFNHTESESQYFMLLLQKEKAGNLELRKYFEAQLQIILDDQLKMHSRVKNFSEVNENIQGQYYSSWKYQAIQTLLSIKKLQNPESLCHYLSLPQKEVLEILEFLVKNNLAVREGNRYLIGPTHIHLSDRSNFLRQHHMNWRLRAMDALESKTNSADLHYSAAITLSKADAIQLRKMILENISDYLKLIRTSNEEAGFAICIDLFEIGKD